MEGTIDHARWRTGRYRHIVFADAIDGADRALDLAPVETIEDHESIDINDGAFLHWLFRQNGLDVWQYRAQALGRRLPACLRKLRVTNISQAKAALERHPQLLEAAMSTMLIGVTSFFRDEAVFAELARIVLPELLRRKRPLRIWSVGCSDGQELYSVAMLLAELGSCEGIELLGTDCRIEATRAAARGIYGESAIRAVSPQRLATHFDYDGAWQGVWDESNSTGRAHQWRIKAPLRAMARWRTADLLTTIEPGPWDLILCRNAAMYLRCNAAAGLWAQLAGAMGRGGYLVLGKAERPAGASGLSSLGQYIYRRSG